MPRTMTDAEMSRTIERRCKNPFRPPVFVVRLGGFIMREGAILYGCDPLKVVQRMGYTGLMNPIRVQIIPGRRGADPRPDVVIFDLPLPSKRRARHGRY